LRTYRVGIIGAGHMGRAHARAWQENARTDVAGIADVLLDRAEATAAEFGVPDAVADYRLLLERSTIDLVAVCTPPFAHCEPSVDALRAGKHVICEKPFTLRVEEAESMVDAARAAGRYLTMCSARGRYTAAALRARALVEAGELGRVYHARSSQFRQRGRPGIDILQDATWFLSRDRAGGGALIDIGVYEIDLMLWLMGNPAVRSVSAATFMGIGSPVTGAPAQDVEDHASLFCQLDNGGSLLLEIAWASNLAGQNTRFVLGDRAGLRFGPLTLFSSPEPGSRDCRSEQVLAVEDSQGGGLPGLIQGMVEALDGGLPPMTPAEDALQVTRVIDAAYRSAGEGRPVSL
jgi:predicted dehydrogenase